MHIQFTISTDFISNILLVIFFILFTIDFLSTLDKWPSYPPIFTLSDYGGFPGSDCTIAFQECFDNVPNDGGIVYIPAGNYVLSNPIDASNKKNLHIIGQGSGANFFTEEK